MVVTFPTYKLNTTHAHSHLPHTTVHRSLPPLQPALGERTRHFTLILTSLITGCRSARDLTQTDILSKSSKVIGSFGIPDLPKWMMLDIISITSAANICGWGGRGGGVGEGQGRGDDQYVVICRTNP